MDEPSLVRGADRRIEQGFSNMSSSDPIDQQQESKAEAAPPFRTTRRRRWKRYVALAMLLLFVSGEIGLRVFAGRNSRYSLRIGAAKEWDPHRRVRLRKSYKSRGFVTNSKGFVGPEFDAKKIPGSYRIVTLGDSASVMPARRNYPRVLEERLRQMRPGRRIDVINASCPGYDSGQARIWYEREVDSYDHDMLLIYLGWNDMGQYNPDGLAYKLDEKGYLQEPNLIQKAFLNCYLLRSLYVIRGHWQRRGDVSFEPLTGEEKEIYESFYPTHFEENLLAVIRLAKAKDRKVRILNYAGVVVESPTPDEQRRMHFPRGMGKRLCKYLALKGAYLKAIDTVASQTDTAVIDIASFFTDPKSRRVFTDSMHFNEQGAEMIGSIVAEAILDDIR